MKSSRHARLRSRFTILLILVCSVFGLEACSSNDSGPTAASTLAATSLLPIAVPSSAQLSKDDCGGATDRIKRAVVGFPQISEIVMIAACGQASIQTTLPAGVLGSSSATTGVKICTAAATVAYQGKVSSVTVVATDGSELAIGLKGADCIP